MIPERAAMVAMAMDIARSYGLFEHIVCGICEKESNWNPWAMRYEPAFKLRYVDPIPGLSQTESVARSISWGLMQTMGQSVRELGYVGWLPELCSYDVGIDWGCKLFAEKLRHADGDYTRALLIWNGGGDPNYPADVLTRSEKYKQQTAT